MTTPRRALMIYLSSSLLWVFLALIYGGQAWLGGGMAPDQAFAYAFREWLAWIILSPLIMWIVGKFPWAPGGRIKAAVVIVVVAVGAVSVAEYTFQLMIGARGRIARTSRPEGPPDGRVGPEAGRRPRRMADDSTPSVQVALSGPMRHMMHFHVPICLFVIVLAHAHAYHRLMLERERRAADLANSLTEAKLMALQMQLQPHFLFNALNAVSTLVHSDPQAADDMIANLSELLRRALSAGRSREVTLAGELDYVRCYLEIERVRFGNRLEVEWRIDPSVREALLPVLCLQPIVENAIRHGVERRLAEVGRIVVAAQKTGERLVVTVADNGPGLSRDVSRPRGHGVGLENTRTRLATLHGAEASVELTDLPEGGCRATLTLPFCLSKAPIL